MMKYEIKNTPYEIITLQ